LVGGAMRERSEINLPTGSGLSFLRDVGVFGFTIMIIERWKLAKGSLKMFFFNYFKIKPNYLHEIINSA
jgi:hypothetical protein